MHVVDMSWHTFSTVTGIPLSALPVSPSEASNLANLTRTCLDHQFTPHALKPAPLLLTAGFTLMPKK